MMKIDKKLIKLYAKIELAKREFFYYCNLKAPDFYKRKYLQKLCNELRNFINQMNTKFLLRTYRRDTEVKNCRVVGGMGFGKTKRKSYDR